MKTTQSSPYNRFCRYKQILTLICFFHLLSVQCVVNDTSLELSLAGYNLTNNASQQFDRMDFVSANATLRIDLTHIPPSPAYFIILQVHAYNFNVTLSYNATIQPHFHVNGTNIGLLNYIATPKTQQLYLKNFNTINVTILISAHVYRRDAPVPGGCNMEFTVETAPYQKLVYTDRVIVVDAQPASTLENQNSCEKEGIQYDMYHLYLPNQDTSSNEYFEGIRQMMSVNNIQQNGRKVGRVVGGSEMRRTYSAYHGTGEVFAVVATYSNVSSAYVPIVTYACSTVSWNDSCGDLSTVFIRIVAAAAFFIGFFSCYLGHKFFKTGTFLVGLLAGGMISYILLTMLGDESLEANILNAILIGSVSGLLWLAIWGYFGIPVLQVTMASLLIGFFFTSVIFYCGVADFQIMQSDLNFWMLFISLLIGIAFLLSPMQHKANILAFSVLGAYCVVTMLDHYVGANLKYIIVNVIRRAVGADFRTAVIDPPYQIRDVSLTSLWIALAVSGYMLQLNQQRGKPPFPPPPYSQRRFDHSARQRRSAPDEKSPLIPVPSSSHNVLVVTITPPSNED